MLAVTYMYVGSVGVYHMKTIHSIGPEYMHECMYVHVHVHVCVCVFE